MTVIRDKENSWCIAESAGRKEVLPFPIYTTNYQRSKDLPNGLPCSSIFEL